MRDNPHVKAPRGRSTAGTVRARPPAGVLRRERRPQCAAYSVVGF